MNLKLRTAWTMTGVVILVMAVIVARATLLANGWSYKELSQTPPVAWLFIGLFFGVPLVLGLIISWWRVFADERARKRRTTPLNLG